MAVLRKEKKGNFTVIDNAIFKDNRLSFKAKGLLCQMLSLPDGWEYSVQGLGKLASDKYSAITSGLRELEEAGYFRREQLMDNGKFAGYEYVISEVPNLDFPFSENPISENTISENQRQLNTNKSNTKKSNTNSLDIYRGLPENLIEALKDFEEMRKSIKKPIKSDRARRMLLNRLNELAGDDIDLKIRMLDEAIFNNWQSVYLPKGDDDGKQVGRVHDRSTESNSGRMAGATVGSGSGTSEGRVTFPAVAFGFQEEA